MSNHKVEFVTNGKDCKVRHYNWVEEKEVKGEVKGPHWSHSHSDYYNLHNLELAGWVELVEVLGCDHGITAAQLLATMLSIKESLQGMAEALKKDNKVSVEFRERVFDPAIEARKDYITNLMGEAGNG